MHAHEPKSSCCKDKKDTDFLFLITLIVVTLGYIFHLLNIHFDIKSVKIFNASIFEIMNKMWWGLALGILFVGILELIPKDLINKILGKPNGRKGIVRAAFAGIIFDLCSHGILLIAMKLYKKGVSLPQVMAFLIASPWNSISLTVILWALIGLKLTLLFVILSFIIAVISGFIFQFLTEKNILPSNPNALKTKDSIIQKKSFEYKAEDTKFNFSFFFQLIKTSLKESEMIIRWIFVGVIIASLIRAFVPDEMFAHYFGATLLGMFLTLIATTIIEVCSEGSVPIAADILARAAAPGNAFVFLMGGVATDYTEILALKETTVSWKIAFFLPLVTIPQIVTLGYFLNTYY